MATKTSIFMPENAKKVHIGNGYNIPLSTEASLAKSIEWDEYNDTSERGQRNLRHDRNSSQQRNSIYHGKKSAWMGENGCREPTELGNAKEHHRSSVFGGRRNPGIMRPIAIVADKCHCNECQVDRYKYPMCDATCAASNGHARYSGEFCFEEKKVGGSHREIDRDRERMLKRREERFNDIQLNNHGGSETGDYNVHYTEHAMNQYDSKSVFHTTIDRASDLDRDPANHSNCKPGRNGDMSPTTSLENVTQARGMMISRDYNERKDRSRMHLDSENPAMTVDKADDDVEGLSPPNHKHRSMDRRLVSNRLKRHYVGDDDYQHKESKMPREVVKVKEEEGACFSNDQLRVNSNGSCGSAETRLTNKSQEEDKERSDFWKLTENSIGRLNNISIKVESLVEENEWSAKQSSTDSSPAAECRRSIGSCSSNNNNNKRETMANKSIGRKLSTSKDGGKKREKPHCKVSVPYRSLKSDLCMAYEEENIHGFRERAVSNSSGSSASDYRQDVEEGEGVKNEEDMPGEFSTYNPEFLLANKAGREAREKEKRAIVRKLKERDAGKKSRAVANWLERKRVAELNEAFELLRKIVPTYGNEDRSLSKIKTLRYASTYINHLAMIADKQRRYGVDDVKQGLLNLLEIDPLIQRCQEHLQTRCVI
eukprot:gene8203-9083_t